jgi:hypothetical protein
MRPNRPYYVRFEEAIHEGEKLEKQKYDNAAMIAKVLNFETGEISLMICRTVMKKEIERNYPGESYVRKCFELIYQNHPNPDVKYKLFTISEIAEPSPEDFNPTENMNDDEEGDADNAEDESESNASGESVHSDTAFEADSDANSESTPDISEPEETSAYRSRSRNKKRSHVTN